MSQACKQAGACDSHEKAPLDAFLAEGERPAPEDALDDLVFCDAGDTTWHTHSFSLQGQEGHAQSESVQRPLVACPPLFPTQPASFGDSDGQRNLDISADQAGWRSNAQHSSTQQLNTSAAVEKVTEAPASVDNPSRASAVKCWGLGLELEDIHMMKDESDDCSMQHNTFGQHAATATEEETDDDALQSE